MGVVPDLLQVCLRGRCEQVSAHRPRDSWARWRPGKASQSDTAVTWLTYAGEGRRDGVDLRRRPASRAGALLTKVKWSKCGIFPAALS